MVVVDSGRSVVPGVESVSHAANSIARAAISPKTRIGPDFILLLQIEFTRLR